MSDKLTYDLFLSYSSKDKAVVRPLAQQLLKDGLKVWFDEWELKPGDSIPAKIEEGLECSRVLVLCMSVHAFGTEWTQLEAGTFRFRDPLNKNRRFIPLKLDNTPIKGSLAQFLYINWMAENREQEYAKLFEACRPLAKSPEIVEQDSRELVAENETQLKTRAEICTYAFSPDGKRVITGNYDKTLKLWDVQTGSCLCTLHGHRDQVWSVIWSADQRIVISGSNDRTVRLWNLEISKCFRVIRGHKGWVRTCLLSSDQRFIVSGGEGHEVRLWDLEIQKNPSLRILIGHTGNVRGLAWSADQHRVLSCADDMTLRLWNMETGECLNVFEGHSDIVFSVALSADGKRALSVSRDQTMRLWNLERGTCLRVFEGHTAWDLSVAWNPDNRHALSASRDGTLRIWDVETGRCQRVLKGHKKSVRTVVWSTDGRRAFSGDFGGCIREWNLSDFVTETQVPKPIASVLSTKPEHVQYMNAKVLLVGDTSAGKTGLSMRLVLNKWEPSDSTVGAWATQWKLPVSSGGGVDREIWLWDFGGQADQRLIHQLFMDETALAVLVFDGQKEDLFETLGQWDRDLTRASHKEFTKLLVAGRVDAGGLRVSRWEIQQFINEHKFHCYLETSAKRNLGCEELKQAIIEGINWDDIPCRTTVILFKRLKEEIIRLKDDGRILMRFNELRETLQLRLSSEFKQFTDKDLHTVLTLLAGPGVLGELKFGSWVLFQPERINAYAQAVIQTLRADEYERGCLLEQKVLEGDLKYHSSIPRLKQDEERFILLAMHQTLVERGICLREQTDKGALLIFPSYYRRERPELEGHPAVLVSYRFNGFLDDIYATLVVRLHHTKSFEQDKLWRFAADFKTLTGKQLGLKLSRRARGEGELQVYFDPLISLEEKIIFVKYIHEHLLQHATKVVRLRHYVCPHCGTSVGNREVAMKKLEEGKKDILCVNCDDPTKRIPLWDQLEELFASPKTKSHVHELQTQATIVLDNESKERALVGEVISTVALAAQISREFNVSDHGIDMEIEFKDDNLEATGQKIYLQLKSGDSYLRERKRDGTEIFTITNERHSRYWMAQKFPVLLVIRNSYGEISWMEIRDWLRHESDNGKKPVKQIVFESERFDVLSVRRWREKVLALDLPRNTI